MGKKRIRFKIRIKNADPWAAGWITHYLYKMVDRNEIERMDLTKIRKSEKSIEVVVVGILIWAGGFIAGKVVDIPYNSAAEKLLRLLRRWQRKRRNMRIDMFFDDEPID